jgi:hypothetical protein
MMQCLAQAVPVNTRKAQGKAQQSVTALLQLPGLDQDALKLLRRQKASRSGSQPCLWAREWPWLVGGCVQGCRG